MKKIVIQTGNRAEYGLLEPLMKEMVSQGLDVKLLVTGEHLSSTSINEIILPIAKKVDIKVSSKKPVDTAKSIGLGIWGIANALSELKPDILVLLGDRYETLAGAIAALTLRIPVAHIAGGEISEGAIDENIRHAITKLSHIHFTMTDVCAARIDLMGEEAWRIHVVGSLCKDGIKIKQKKEVEKELGISLSEKTMLCIFHPVTLEFEKTQDQIKQLLSAINKAYIQTIMIYPNTDTGGDVIIKEIKKAMKNNNKLKTFKNINRDTFLSLMSYVDLMIGNSSSGLVESPMFKLPVINVGNRQRGRDRERNVVDVECDSKEITNMIKKILNNKNFRTELKNVKNEYSDGQASKRITDIIKNLQFDKDLIMKKYEVLL